jgi:hypothetical protein
VSQPHRGPDQQSASEQREHRPHKDRWSTFHRYALPPRVPRVGRLAPFGSGPEAGGRTCGERRADGTPTDRSDRSGVGYPAARPRAVDTPHSAHDFGQLPGAKAPGLHNGHHWR